MKRNKKGELEKEYRTLLNSWHDTCYAIRNLGYVELETPIHHGYEIYYELRDDIARSSIGPKMELLIENFTSSSWCKDTSFIRKYKKTNYEKIKPLFNRVETHKYENFYEWTKQYFRIDYNKYVNSWHGTRYYYYLLDIPEYYLVEKIRKSYITHRQIIDADLMSKEAEILKKLKSKKFYKFWGSRNFSDKPYSEMFNRKDRRYNKVMLKKNLNTYYCDDNTLWDIDFGDTDEITRENYKDRDFRSWQDGWGHEPYEFKYNHKRSAVYAYW